MSSAIKSAVEALRGAMPEIATADLNFATSTDAALRILRAIDNPEIDIEALARIVSSEPLLSAKVVQMANSVALNPNGTAVSDLKQAVMRVGMAPIRSLAMALTLDQLRRSQRLAPCRDLANRLWERSIHVAALSYVVARRLSSLPGDEAMLAGIVHDLGRFYLLGIAAERCPQLLRDPVVLVGALDEMQSEITPGILQALGLPEAVVTAVRERSHFSGEMPPKTVSEVLFLACWLAPPPNPFEDPDLRESARAQEGAALGLDRHTIADFMSASGDEIYSIVLALES